MAVAVAVSLMMASCAGSHTTDPYAIPSRITPAYVQRVLNALEGVNGRATRLIVENRRLVPKAAEILRSTSTSSEYELQRRIWSTQISSHLSDYLADPGPVNDRLIRLIYARDRCVFASIKRDYSKVQKVPQISPVTYISLVTRPSFRRAGSNPTPWLVAFLGYTTSGQAPSDPCA